MVYIMFLTQFLHLLLIFYLSLPLNLLNTANIPISELVFFSIIGETIDHFITIFNSNGSWDPNGLFHFLSIYLRCQSIFN